MHDLAIKILAEIPVDVSSAISRALTVTPEGSPDDVAELVMQGINEGQRWAIAKSAVAREVMRLQRQRVRSREQAVFRRATGMSATRFTAQLEEDNRLAACTEMGLDPTTTTRSEALGARVRAAAALLAEVQRKADTFDLMADLLDSSFSLGDGTSVTWGDATLEQHSERATSLFRLATGTVQTAKLHEDAIAMLDDAGVSTLRELARVRAA